MTNSYKNTNPIHLDKILSLTESYFNESNILNGTVHTLEPAELLLMLKNNSFSYDATILDIELKITDGIECAREINIINPNCKIIFITSFQKYMLDVYDVSHTYVVPKNLMDTFLIKALKKITTEYVSDTLQQQIVFYQKGGTLCLRYRDIIYFEQSGHTSTIFTLQGDIHKITHTLKDLQNVLQDIPQFLQTHKSYIVNIIHVKEFKRKGLVLNNNKVIPISRTYYNVVKDIFMSYVADMNSI